MWTLVSSSTTVAPGSNEFSLPNEGIAHIIVSAESNHAEVVRVLDPRMQRELGRIIAGPFGVKLEAVNEKLTIIPGQSHAPSPSSAKFELQPRTDNHSEAIFLRHGDILNLSSLESSFTCQWTDSEVQVDSSAVPNARRIAETPEDEVGDEGLTESKPDARTQNRHFRLRATPQLPQQQSFVVQETPTAARPEPVSETFSTARTSESQNTNVFQSTEVPAIGSVMNKTRPSLRKADKSSPQVQIPPKSNRKRSTSALRENLKFEQEALTVGIKRTKTNNDEDTRDARLSSIETTSQKSGKKRKKRPTSTSHTEALDEAEEADLMRSPQSTQDSTCVTTEVYDGHPPRVASSNSTITKSSQAVKLLKKQGGAYVEKLTDDFNILCVRDSDLQKKTKVLYAIARGIPIVTDAWLLESAKEGRLLSLSAYKPSTSKQEEEWGFRFDDVFGQPQTPFEGYTIHFTKNLRGVYESFPEVVAVCKAAGAKNVTSSRMNTTGDNIVLANNYEDDPEAQKLIKDGITCYTKDLFTISIFRGYLDLESDEFKIESPNADSTPSKEKKKRGRKTM
ncbi:hypothetical protein COCMIDRAFT_36703 [Bipolaris oryzae ATCC 44560]|uniref:BRCT domain-containing protein n=1 Tax=Bipolaris oryzae ATCC 44560 TaxID=930090 RepID=W6ZPS0_COCMI|nr:uncharacterized protein COCMIDRAFT_36703 [Bipolaris oryzae ATCC 44560]EUC45611.1 hypothetical protein COCMIDRAFT_36703 [Bipolaris oryzae ATCC 44560]